MFEWPKRLVPKLPVRVVNNMKRASLFEDGWRESQPAGHPPLCGVFTISVLSFIFIEQPLKSSARVPAR